MPNSSSPPSPKRVLASDLYVVALRDWGGAALNMNKGSIYVLGRADAFVASRVVMGERLEQIAVGLSSKFGLRMRQSVDVARTVSVRLGATRELAVASPTSNAGGEPFVQHVTTLEATSDDARSSPLVSLSVSAVELAEGALLLVGPPPLREALVDLFFSHGHATVLDRPEVDLTRVLPEVRFDGGRARGLSYVWLLGRERKGAGLMFARRHVRETLPSLLASAMPPCPRSHWAATFEACVALADAVPILETTLPGGADALSAAVGDFCLNARRLEGSP